jgi:hypothetical protein
MKRHTLSAQLLAALSIVLVTALLTGLFSAPCTAQNLTGNQARSEALKLRRMAAQLRQDALKAQRQKIVKQRQLNAIRQAQRRQANNRCKSVGGGVTQCTYPLPQGDIITQLDSDIHTLDYYSNLYSNQANAYERRADLLLRQASQPTRNYPPQPTQTAPPVVYPNRGGGTTSSFVRGGSPHCFIATAAFGSPMAGEVMVLREFRDRYLLTSALGRRLVDLYYRYSPPIAAFIANHETARTITRLSLQPIVYSIKYPFRAAFALLVAAILFRVWLTKRTARKQKTVAVRRLNA